MVTAGAGLRKAINAARIKARAAVEAYYEGLCSVIEYQDITDEITNITDQEEVTTIQNQPCKLSFERLTSTSQTDTAATVSQTAKLFLAPEIQIKPGSKIVVEWRGKTHEFSCSGEPAIYATHQEIILDLFRGWA